MNHSSSTPPELPSVPGAALPNPSSHPRDPWGEAPGEWPEVTGVWGVAEAMLREPRRVLAQLRRPNPLRAVLALLAVAVGCGLIYGAVIGTFSLGPQLWAAPLKVVAGLLLSSAICLPSLYIFACLAGARARLMEVVGMVAGLMALMTVLLLGFAPVAWVFSQSTESVVAMGGLHLSFWGVAIYFGIRFLRLGFVPTDGKPAAFRLWIWIYLLVMLQMTTALRPIVGRAETILPVEKKFFLKHWWDQFGA